MADRKEALNKISDVLYGLVSAKKGAGLGGALFPGAQQRAAVRKMSPSELMMQEIYTGLSNGLIKNAPPDDITEKILNKQGFGIGDFELTSATLGGGKWENIGSKRRARKAEADTDLSLAKATGERADTIKTLSGVNTAEQQKAIAVAKTLSGNQPSAQSVETIPTG